MYPKYCMRYTYTKTWFVVHLKRTFVWISWWLTWQPSGWPGPLSTSRALCYEVSRQALTERPEGRCVPIGRGAAEAEAVTGLRSHSCTWRVSEVTSVRCGPWCTVGTQGVERGHSLGPCLHLSLPLSSHRGSLLGDRELAPRAGAPLGTGEPAGPLADPQFF